MVAAIGRVETPKPGRPSGRRHAASGILVCAKCGTKMVGSGVRYQCNTAGCGGQSIQGYPLERYLVTEAATERLLTRLREVDEQAEALVEKLLTAHGAMLEGGRQTRRRAGRSGRSDRADDADRGDEGKPPRHPHGAGLRRLRRVEVRGAVASTRPSPEATSATTGSVSGGRRARSPSRRSRACTTCS